MADTKANKFYGTSNVPVTLQDNGDNTFAEKLATVKGNNIGTKTFTAVSAVTGGTLAAAASTTRKYVRIHNAEASTTAYLNKAAFTGGVTTAVSIPLAAGTFFEDLYSKDAWYVATASGTADIRVLVIS